jgi:hypothetical protein
MALQFAEPFVWPRREQAKLRRELKTALQEGAHFVKSPTMMGSLAEACDTRQTKLFWLTQLHTDSSGVGGSVWLAKKEAFWAGQAIWLAVTDDSAGEVGNAVALYIAESLVKSADGITLSY